MMRFLLIISTVTARTCTIVPLYVFAILKLKTRGKRQAQRRGSHRRGDKTAVVTGRPWGKAQERFEH